MLRTITHENARFGAAALAATVFALVSLAWSAGKLPRKTRALDRRNFPKTLESWRRVHEIRVFEALWNALQPVLDLHGLRPWAEDVGPHLELPKPDNYIFLGANTDNKNSVVQMTQYSWHNGLSHFARSRDGRDYVLRIMTAGGEGHGHLRIVKRLCRTPDILLSNNHILPMVNEIVYEDILIGVFPRLLYDLSDAIGNTRNSVEDILYMLIQALEGITYIHKHRIGHRDLFLNNFLVEWLPESLAERGSMPRPRVYLIDFETAVEFPENSLESDRRCTEFPVYPREIYRAPVAPELESGEPYCPFQLDMWQFGRYLCDDFPTGISEVNQFFIELVSPKPENRPTAHEALRQMDTYVRNTPPSLLHVRSLVTYTYWD